MIHITNTYKPAASINKMKKAGFTVTLAAVAADIRHNHTNYDDMSNLLGTDEAEALILSTYKAVVSVNKLVAPAMKQWAQSKLRTLA